MAILSFFAVLLIIAAQAWAHALPEQKAKFSPGMVVPAMIVLAMRSGFIHIQFSHPSAVVLHQPTQVVALGVLRTFLPVFLNLSTCVVAMASIFILRAGYGFLEPRAVEREQ
jgi:hypothetical protein